RLHAHTTLAVHSGRLLERAHEDRASSNRRRDDSPQTPHVRLVLDPTVAIRTVEEPAAEVLAVEVLREAQRLVVGRVDDQAVRVQTRTGRDLRDRTEDRVRDGVTRSDRATKLGLHTGTVQEAGQVLTRAVAAQNLVLLEDAQGVQEAVVDLRHNEVEVLDHLVRNLD